MKLTVNTHEYEINDGSTFSAISMTADKMDAFDAIYADLRNCTHVNIGGTEFTNLVPGSVTMNCKLSDDITMTFVLREKTHDELVQDQINELQNALAELAGGMN